MTDYVTALQEAIRFMRKHDRFLIVTHVNPDGDTTSAALACALLLEDLGKSYCIVNEGETPEKFSFLPRFSSIKDLSKDIFTETFSHVIAVDAADYKRMGDVPRLFADDVNILNIDHHPTNDLFGQINVVRADAAATVEIMFELLKAGEFTLNEQLAACIYTGLLTDTGGFRYANTSPNVLKIASELLGYGIKPGELAERCLEEITLAHILLLRRALQTLKITHRKLTASLQVTRDDMREAGASGEDTSGLVNYCRNIEGVEIGVFFHETGENQIKVSFRSRASADVAQIAKELGGGGHARAAGCTIVGSLAEAEAIVFEKISEALGVQADE